MVGLSGNLPVRSHSIDGHDHIDAGLHGKRFRLVAGDDRLIGTFNSMVAADTTQTMYLDTLFGTTATLSALSTS